MSKTDLGARQIYHHKRDSIEAHLTIVMAALAVSHWLERQTRTPLLCHNASDRVAGTSSTTDQERQFWPRSCVPGAAPLQGVTEPEATQSSSEKLRCAGTRSEMQVPGDARVAEHCMDPTSVGQPRVDKRHRIVQTCNLTYCTTVTFVTIAAASLSPRSVRTRARRVRIGVR